MDNCITEGKAVPPEMIRPFTESSDLLGNTAALTARLKEDGYLFFRGALDQDEVLAARAEIFERLAAVGEVKDPPAEGIFSGASRRQEMANDLGEFWKSVWEGPKLRQVANPAQLPYSLQLLDDDSLRVQKAVAAALGYFGPALDEHLAQLPEPPSAIQKGQIHELLGRFSGSDPVAASTAEAEPLFRPGQLVQHSR